MAGQTAEATRWYRQALSIAEELARRDPGNTEYQRDLRFSHNKLGISPGRGRPRTRPVPAVPQIREELAGGIPATPASSAT